jgi:hypothetical protein
MNRMNLYPNMYIFLIAVPGVGKTVSGTQTEILWRGLEHHHVAPTNASKAALIDVLAESKREIILPKLGGQEEFHALNIMSGEFGAFMPTWDGEFMNTLVTLWDGGRYTERKRGGDLRIDIPQPLLNMLACATPDFMVNWMPEGAWKQGFASRLMLIYSGEVILGDLWSEDDHANAMGKITTVYSLTSRSSVICTVKWSSCQKQLQPFPIGIEVVCLRCRTILSSKVILCVGPFTSPKSLWCERPLWVVCQSALKIINGVSTPC